MTDQEEKELIKTTKNTIIKTIISVFAACVVGLTGFYYTSTLTLAQHTEKIEQHSKELKKVTTVPVLNQSKIKNIEKDVARIEKKIDNNNEETKESIKELRKQNMKVLELLYQIKQNQN